MVKRHNPRPPGRRRPTPTPMASHNPGDPAATAEEKVLDRDDDAALAPDIVVPEASEMTTAPQDQDVTEQDVTETEPPATDHDVDVPVPALVALQPPPSLDDAPLVVATGPVRVQARFVPTDLTVVGATFQAFVLNEGLSAVAHWRALSRAQSPAEVIRLQVDEMQRAAEASLTCSLACMSRLAGLLGRSTGISAA